MDPLTPTFTQNGIDKTAYTDQKYEVSKKVVEKIKISNNAFVKY